MKYVVKFSDVDADTLKKLYDCGFKNKNTKTKCDYLKIDFENEIVEYCNTNFISKMFIEYDSIKSLKSRIDSKYVNPEWFRHEALHTTNVLLETIYDHLVEHQYYHQKINPEFNKCVDDAIDSLFRAYQSVDEECEVKKYMCSNP